MSQCFGTRVRYFPETRTLQNVTVWWNTFILFSVCSQNGCDYIIMLNWLKIKIRCQWGYFKKHTSAVLRKIQICCEYINVVAIPGSFPAGGDPRHRSRWWRGRPCSGCNSDASRSPERSAGGRSASLKHADKQRMKKRNRMFSRYSKASGLAGALLLGVRRFTGVWQQCYPEVCHLSDPLFCRSV